MANSKDRPTRDEIAEFILHWKDRPDAPPLKENEITVKKLQDITGYGYAWAKKRLNEMRKAGLCTSYPCTLKGGVVVNVFVFETLPKF